MNIFSSFKEVQIWLTQLPYCEVNFVNFDICLCKSWVKTFVMILYFWCFLYHPKCSTKIKMECLGMFFLKIVFNRLFLSAPNKNRSLVRDLPINFANINTTISNTLLIISHFLNNCFILVYLQKDLFGNDILWKKGFVGKF